MVFNIPEIPQLSKMFCLFSHPVCINDMWFKTSSDLFVQSIEKRGNKFRFLSQAPVLTHIPKRWVRHTGIIEHEQPSLDCYINSVKYHSYWELLNYFCETYPGFEQWQTNELLNNVGLNLSYITSDSNGQNQNRPIPLDDIEESSREYYVQNNPRGLAYLRKFNLKTIKQEIEYYQQQYPEWQSITGFVLFLNHLSLVSSGVDVPQQFNDFHSNFEAVFGAKKQQYGFEGATDYAKRVCFSFENKESTSIYLNQIGTTNISVQYGNRCFSIEADAYEENCFYIDNKSYWQKYVPSLTFKQFLTDVFNTLGFELRF